MLTQGRAKLIEEVCLGLCSQQVSTSGPFRLGLDVGDIVPTKFRNNDFMPQLATVGNERHYVGWSPVLLLSVNTHSMHTVSWLVVLRSG